MLSCLFHHDNLIIISLRSQLKIQFIPSPLASYVTSDAILDVTFDVTFDVSFDVTFEFTCGVVFAVRCQVPVFSWPRAILEGLKFRKMYPLFNLTF